MSASQRVAMLRDLRNAKMSRSAHAYVRGSTTKFYSWLEERDEMLPHGPPVWICGDCHVSNLGPLADRKGRVAIQIRDLDQTVIGNPAHDIVRLGLSLASAARGSDLPGVTTARILDELVEGYRIGLDGNFQKAKDRSNRPADVQALLAQSVRRRWHHLAAERLEDVRPEIPLGRRFWKPDRMEQAALRRLFRSKNIASFMTSLGSSAKDSSMELMDIAYWVKGCSSLGRLRYAALFRAGKGKSASHYMVDVKEATKAAAPRVKGARMPRSNADRVVSGAKALSPNLGERMVAGVLLERPVVIRELMPQDLKIEIGALTREQATAMSRYLGGVVGRAHGRQMNDADRKSWSSDLVARRQNEMAAPSWLWRGVVELIALHETEYLEHCRRFALLEAA